MASLRHPTRALAVAGVTLTLALTGCNRTSNLPASGSSGGSGSASSASNVVLTQYNGTAGAFEKNFNPFSPTVLGDVQGGIYETLFYYNPLASIDTKPSAVLAESYAWNADGTQITVKTRSGVKWSDGQPFTANDVAFTFNMINKNATLNPSGTSPTATAKDDSTVVLTYKKPAYADGPTALGRTWIVPEHLWKSVSDPASYKNESPVGTGPFILDTFTAESYLLKSNGSYWQPGKPHIGGVRLISVNGNDSATNKWLAGEIDYMSVALPNLQGMVSKNPKLAYTNTGTGQVALFACANPTLGCTGPQTENAVRKALYYAMDRQQLSKLAWFDMGTDISPSYALVKRDKDFISPDIQNAPWTAQVQKATSLLEGGGWKKGTSGYYEKNGQTLKLTLTVVSGWTDYITAVDTMTQQFKQAGIQLVAQQVSMQQWNDAKSSGKYQLAIDGMTQGQAPDPYYLYQKYFATSNTAKVGANADPWMNVSRFSDSRVDKLLADAGSTNDTARKKQDYFQIQKIVSDYMPYVPVLAGPGLTEYSTAKVTGWPTADNLYAYPMSFAVPDAAQVLMNVQPAK